MLQSVRRYLALGRSDRRALMRAFVWLAAMDLALRVAGFRRIVRRHRSAAPLDVMVGPEAVRRAAQYARWLEVASRHHVVRARCLHRSLVLHHWLRRDGLPSELRIGVQMAGRALRAHAWVELGGQAVNERPSELAAFTPLAHPCARQAAVSARAGGSDMWWRQEQQTWV